MHTLHKNCPGKRIYLARQDFTCKDMKYINLEKLAESMKTLQYQIEVPEPIRERAARALNKMLAYTGYADRAPEGDAATVRVGTTA